MSSNGRRRWRVWARNQRKAGIKGLMGRHAMSLRNGATTVPPIPRPAFAARSLVGMSMTRRRVIARSLAPVFMLLSGGLDLYKRYDVEEFAAWLRTDGVLGDRLLPCSGCIGCADVCFEGPNCRWCREHPARCKDGVLLARKARKARG